MAGQKFLLGGSLRICLLWQVLFVTCILAATARAESIPIDDFSDENDEGWTRMDSNIGKAWGPGIYDLSTQAYRLATTGVVPGGGEGRGFLLSLWDESTDPMFSDGFLRAKVTVDTFDGVGALLFRFSGDIDSGLNGYAFVGVGGNSFVFNRIVDTAVARRVHINGLVPQVGEEWWMEGGAVGNQFSMKVWRVGEAEPESPQIAFTDTAFSSGVFGVDANMNFGSQTPGMVNTTFDDIFFSTILAGDYNGNGLVEQGDLDLVLLHWGQPTRLLPDTWTLDLPLRGVEQETLDKVLLNWGSGAPLGAASVPEPSGLLLALVLLAMTGFFVRHRLALSQTAF